MTGASQVAPFYQFVIDDVINNLREAFHDEGVDDHILQDLKMAWSRRIEQSGVLAEPQGDLAPRPGGGDPPGSRPPGDPPGGKAPAKPPGAPAPARPATESLSDQAAASLAKPPPAKKARTKPPPAKKPKTSPTNNVTPMGTPVPVSNPVSLSNPAPLNNTIPLNNTVSMNNPVQLSNPVTLSNPKPNQPQFIMSNNPRPIMLGSNLVNVAGGQLQFQPSPFLNPQQQLPPGMFFRQMPGGGIQQILPMVQQQGGVVQQILPMVQQGQVPGGVIRHTIQPMVQPQIPGSAPVPRNIIKKANQVDGLTDDISSDEDGDGDDEDEFRDQYGEIDDYDLAVNDEEQPNVIEDEEPLNSGDDVSEEESDIIFDSENVIVCQYDKITRSRNRWKFQLKDGIMNIGGRDYIYHKASGDAEW